MKNLSLVLLMIIGGLSLNAQPLKPFNEFIISILENSVHDIEELRMLTDDYCNQDKEVLRNWTDMIKFDLEFAYEMNNLITSIATGRNKMILDFAKPYSDSKYQGAMDFCDRYKDMVDIITCPQETLRLYGRLFFIDRNAKYMLNSHLKTNEILDYGL